MTSLRDALADYLKLRRRLGFVTGRIIAGTSEQLSQRIASHDLVRWVRDGHQFEEPPPTPPLSPARCYTTTGGQ